MFRLSNVFKTFDGNTVLGGVSFTLSRGDCVGLIGANACGKSTLLSIAACDLQPDRGTVWIEPDKTVGYFRQDTYVESDCSVGTFLAPALLAASATMQNLEEAHRTDSQESSEYIAWQRRYFEAFERFEALGGYVAIAHLHSVLNGLGLSNLCLEDSTSCLSGGQKTRLALARILMDRPDIILLDEPTNNLDVMSQDWLAKALKVLNSAILLVSHDRAFLDQVTTRTFELDSMSRQIREYGGNYSWFKLRKEQETQRQWRQYNQQQQRADQLRKDIQATKNQALATELTTVQDYLRGRAKKVAAKAKARERRLTKMLSKENKVEKPRDTDQRIRLNLGENSCKARANVLLEAQNMSIGYSQHAILEEVNICVFGNSRIAIVGSNGSGKSTLIKTLIEQIKPIDGTLWHRPNATLTYLAQNHVEQLPMHRTALEYFQDVVEERGGNKRLLAHSESRTFLNRFLFAGQQVLQPIESLSHGQRTKLILATFMAVGSDLLILDEPTNFLDIPTRECMEKALSAQAYKGALLIVSHDRVFLENVGVEALWILKDGELKGTSVDLNTLNLREMVVY